MTEPGERNHKRAIVIVIDGCGVGASPDAEAFGDPVTSNTIANTAKATGGLTLPNLKRLGLGNITSIEGVSREDRALALFGKLEESSNGKDTQTGHWEMMGIVSTQAFPLYPDGFPEEIMARFIKETGCGGILCNKPASGTKVLDDLGEEHRKTGYPIVYTSGDSVFQIATNVEVTPLSTLYRWCEIARGILQGPHRVGRVIARPFKGGPGAYTRLGGDRRDYAVPPPGHTFLDEALAARHGVLGIGKIEDIFVGQGLSHAKHTGSNTEGLELTLQAIENKLVLDKLKIAPAAPDAVQLIFTNLVDTDSLFGHRRNPSGYAGALVEIDAWLARMMQAMDERDLLIISSDHGNDPTAAGTDHTREYVPLLAYSPALVKAGAGGSDLNAGTRKGFADIAASLAEWLDVRWNGPGKSFVAEAARAVR